MLKYTLRWRYSTLFNYKEYLSLWWTPSRLSIGAYGGYGDSNGAYEQDGQFAQGRLRLVDYYRMNFGAEVGVQSGNTMRLDANSFLIAAAGGLPIQSTLKPLVDLLITMKSQLSQSDPLFGIVK